MKKLFIPIAVLLVIDSCSYRDSSDSISCNGLNLSFRNDVLPIITASCAANASCHAAGSKQGPGALTNFTQVQAASNDIKVAVESGIMPQNSSLTSTERNNIICWIRNGTLDN